MAFIDITNILPTAPIVYTKRYIKYFFCSQTNKFCYGSIIYEHATTPKSHLIVIDGDLNTLRDIFIIDGIVRSVSVAEYTTYSRIISTDCFDPTVAQTTRFSMFQFYYNGGTVIIYASPVV